MTTSTPSWSAERFDPETASDADIEALTALQNATRAERLPDDPPLVPERVKRDLLGLRFLDSIDLTRWVVRHGGAIVATANANRPLRENRHLTFLWIDVHPDHRRRGLGSTLLREIADLSRAEDRTLLMTHTLDTAPAGAAFIERVGGRSGIAAHLNQLRLAEVDRAMLARWREQARERATDFELLFRTPPYPEEELAAIAAMLEVMNTEPRGELEMEDFSVTPRQIRQEEARLAHGGHVSWSFFARERSSGELAGFTQTVWDPAEPHIVHQWGTAVKPRFRGHGLGKWLKATMLEKVLAERPEATVVRTGNADSNEPMLAINRALGFRPYIAETTWQVEREVVEGYLRERER